MRLFQEFKAFALKGNVVDLAAGVMIGGAFSNIVNSFVADLVTPLVGMLTGSLDFSRHFIRIGQIPTEFKGDPYSLHDLQAWGIPVLGYGHFLTILLNFIISASVIFMMVKALNRLQRAVHLTPSEHADVTPEDIILLREIRDLMAKKER